MVQQERAVALWPIEFEAEEVMRLQMLPEADSLNTDVLQDGGLCIFTCAHTCSVSANPD